MNRRQFDDRIFELLEQWEDAVEQGREVSVDELCQDSPELAHVLKRRINALKATAWLDRSVVKEDGEGDGDAEEDYGDFPETLGRYLLLEPIGSGGFAHVFRGFDPQLQRAVAIKVPRLARMQSVESTNRLLDEARKVAHLKHPGIVPIHDVGQEGDYCYIISDLVDGRDLSKAFDEQRPGSRTLVRIVAEVADILSYAQERGFIHRDIKPANILLDQEGRAYLTDFGIAVSSHQIRYNDDTSLGTLGYMSPEQLDEEVRKLDARTDIYSLGVVLFELLTGQKPFRAESITELRREIELNSPLQPVMAEHQVPKTLARICLKCLQKTPASRYATARELAKDLQQLLEAKPKSAAQKPRQETAKPPASLPPRVSPRSTQPSTKSKLAERKPLLPRYKSEPAENLDTFDPYHKWLGIPKGKRPPTHYQLLGVSVREQSEEVITAAAKRQTLFVEEFRGTQYEKIANRLLYEIEEAKFCLLSPEMRPQYDETVSTRRRKRLFRRRASSTPSGSKTRVVGEGRVAGEGTEFVRSYLGIVSILLPAFIIMAAVSFWFPWQEVVFSRGDGTPVATPQGDGAPDAVQGVVGQKGDRAQQPISPPAEITNSIGMKLKLIPAGEFMMGSESPESRPREQPVHRVRITKPFYMGVFEVTQREFEEVLGVNPSHFTGDPEQPVDQITWKQIHEFLEKLTNRPEEREAGRSYYLPTEAQWEYAARAGTTTSYYFGETISSHKANVNGRYPGVAKEGPYLKRTAKVGSYEPNAFGLHDMIGNLKEVVADWYGENYYSVSPVDDPQGPSSGALGISRGGGWADWTPASWVRQMGPRSYVGHEMGFRVVCETSQAPGLLGQRIVNSKGEVASLSQNQRDTFDLPENVTTVDATIRSIDVSRRVITIRRKSKTASFDVSRKATISADGFFVSFGSLKPGQRAFVTFDPEYDVVVKIDIITD